MISACFSSDFRNHSDEVFLSFSVNFENGTKSMAKNVEAMKVRIQQLQQPSFQLASKCSGTSRPPLLSCSLSSTCPVPSTGNPGTNTSCPDPNWSTGSPASSSSNGTMQSANSPSSSPTNSLIPFSENSA